MSLANVCILKMSPRQGCSNGLRRFLACLGGQTDQSYIGCKQHNDAMYSGLLCWSLGLGGFRVYDRCYKRGWRNPKIELTLSVSCANHYFVKIIGQ